uniref:Uncharacterized protein n=1 Tax=Anguilla anguilla TaxID=7936 RepID=A0A0E9R2D9_ANGAN
MRKLSSVLFFTFFYFFTLSIFCCFCMVKENWSE